MKFLFIFLLFALFSFQGFAQFTESRELYITAIEKYTIELDTYYKRFRSDTNKVIYIAQTNLVDSFPDSINGYKIIILTSANYKKIYKENNLSGHEVLQPIVFVNGDFYITIAPYGGKIKRGKLRLEIGDWTNVWFTYDCDKKKFIYLKTQNNGI